MRCGSSCARTRSTPRRRTPCCRRRGTRGASSARGPRTCWRWTPRSGSPSWWGRSRSGPWRSRPASPASPPFTAASASRAASAAWLWARRTASCMCCSRCSGAAPTMWRPGSASPLPLCSSPLPAPSTSSTASPSPAATTPSTPSRTARCALRRGPLATAAAPAVPRRALRGRRGHAQVTGNTIKLPSPCCAVTRLGKNVWAATVDGGLHCFHIKGKKNFSLQLPAPATALAPMPVMATHSATPLAVGLTNGEVRCPPARGKGGGGGERSQRTVTHPAGPANCRCECTTKSHWWKRPTWVPP